MKAPQTNERGDAFWSYSLVKEVTEGDLIYHYDGTAQAIVARSHAIGVVWDGEVIWAARGSSARSANIEPHARPGWYLGLERFERLSSPVTLDAIREKDNSIRLLKTSLEREVGEPSYFPFEIGDRRPIRPKQGDLFKLPTAFLELFGIDAPQTTAPAESRRPSGGGLGDEYRPADELAAPRERDPFAVDPALVERGVRGHAKTQNGLARHLRSLAIEPRSARADEPNFDIAWRADDSIFVAEVKSLTVGNEEKQLRLGLGQVLRYAHQLGSGGAVVPVLVVERCPTDSSWEQLCKQFGVILAWPDVFSERIPRHSGVVATRGSP